MQIDLWQRRLGWYCLVAIIMLSGAVAQSKLWAADEATPPAQPIAPKPVERRLFEAREAEANDPNGEHRRPAVLVERMLRMAGERGDDGGKYWLGVECREVPPELQSQLGLKEGEGLVVLQIVQDSPAAKSGLKQHDIILSAGDSKLAHPQELVKAVNGADGKELSLKIIRGGKEQTIAATPLERPQSNVSVIARPGPGVMMSGMGIVRPQIPDNVSVAIVRQGNKPAKITVNRGDEKWEVAENELDKLPNDVRPFVQGMLGQNPGVLTVGNLNGLNPNQPGGNANAPLVQALRMLSAAQGQNGPGVPPVQPIPPIQPNGLPGVVQLQQNGQRPQMNQPGQFPPDLMQRLDEIDRRLQQLQDEIRGARGPREPMQQPGMDGQGPPNRGTRVAPLRDGDRRGAPEDGRRPGPPDEDRRQAPRVDTQ